MPKISSCFDDTPRRRCRPSSAPQRPSPCSAAKRSVGFIVTTLLVLAGCTLSRAPDLSGGEAAPDPDLTVLNFTEMALLLLLADRLTYEPFSLDRAAAGGPEARRLLADTLARLGDPRAVPLLEALLLDEDAEVRRRAVFALGRVGGDAAALLLLRHQALGESSARATLAVQGLAIQGLDAAAVESALRGLPAQELWVRLLPDLHLFPADRTRELLAIGGLAAEEGWLRRRAAFVLGRTAQPRHRQILLSLLDDEDPGVRVLATAALSEVGIASDLDRLLQLCAESDTSLVAESLRTAARIIRSGRAAAPPSWRALLLQLLEDPRPAVGVAALEAASAWLLDDEIGAQLARLAVSGSVLERRLALRGLARARDPRAADLMVAAFKSGDPDLRAEAARAAGALGGEEILVRLVGDEAASVRQAAFLARLASGGPRQPILSAFLADADAGVRAAALRELVSTPVLPYEEIVHAVVRMDPQVPAPLLEGVGALEARALAAISERGAIVGALETLAQVSTHPTRVAAATVLAELGRAQPPPGPATTARSPGDYRSILTRTRAVRWLKMETERGDVVFKVDCPDVPLSCVSFMQLANQGFFDGTRFHHAVPGRLLEGGDPRGDGWGGPGFTLRDEIGAHRLASGSLILAKSAPHSSGSRFLILLADAPALEVTHTRLGEAVSGAALLTDLIEDDLILRLRETGEPGRPRTAHDRS